MRDPRLFWSHFSDIRETVEARLAAFQGVVPACALNRVAPGLAPALVDYDRGLTLEIERFEGIFAMIVGAADDVARFDSARELALAAPMAPGWLMRALRPRRDPGEALRADALTLRTDRLRFAYGLANDRMVVMILAEDAPFEEPGGHFLARRLVGDLLGEEDYGLFISDARLMRYADWLAATPGGRSWPIAELATRLDAIFHPPRRMWRPRSVQPQALCA
jgi:hypothetical protein